MITNNIQIRRAQENDRAALQRMLELYQYDLSDLHPQEINDQGEYGYELDRYWRDSTCHPFVALVSGFYAGFALVDARVKLGVPGHWMDQFFILKKHRRSGVGSMLARWVFGALHGYWETGQMLSNLPAQSFWRRVVGEYAKDGNNEQVVSLGKSQWVVQSFQSGAAKLSTPPSMLAQPQVHGLKVK
jgi:predicted acetyltransferase